MPGKVARPIAPRWVAGFADGGGVSVLLVVCGSMSLSAAFLLGGVVGLEKYSVANRAGIATIANRKKGLRAFTLHSLGCLLPGLDLPMRVAIVCCHGRFSICKAVNSVPPLPVPLQTGGLKTRLANLTDAGVLS